jgi:hypothetical protein
MPPSILVSVYFRDRDLIFPRNRKKWHLRNNPMSLYQHIKILGQELSKSDERL